MFYIISNLLQINQPLKQMKCFCEYYLLYPIYKNNQVGIPNILFKYLMKRDYDAAKSLILKSPKAGLTRFARWTRVRNVFQRSTHYLIPKEKPLENQGASL